jgi:hypothetical protein
MIAEVIHLPYSIERRTVALFSDLLLAVLGEGGHTVVLDRIEADSVKGWSIHLRCANPATIGVLREWAERKCHPDDPLSLL